MRGPEDACRVSRSISAKDENGDRFYHRVEVLIEGQRLDTGEE